MFSFLSIEFSLFFIAFFALYWSLIKRPQWQNVLLALASYFIVYMMAGVVAVSILFAFSSVMYAISLAMQRQQQHKKKWLIVGIILTLAQLSLFKYYDFFRQAVASSLETLNFDSSGLMANLILPLGLSYYSFQAISYLVSRYHDEVDVPAFNWVQLLTHFSLFMTISAGPIARAKSATDLTDIQGNPCGMSEQIRQTEPRQLLFPLLACALILLALIKKWWLAGYLADTWVKPVFTNPMQYHSLEVLLAIYGYTLQLFFDFSGYSEMMIAFGLLLGLRVPVNFKAPLLAHNIRDFWDRWHISLSTWIRDYIYIPLGGSRVSFTRTQVNLLIAMGLSGIWHGSSWNFLFWGLLHGFAIILLNCGDKIYQRGTRLPMKQARNALAQHSIWGKILGMLVTFHFVAFCFVFFRASNFEEALLVFKALFSNTINIAWVNNPLYLLIILIISWIIYAQYHRHQQVVWQKVQTIPQSILYVLLFLVFMLLIVFAPSGIPGFIYANF